LAAEWSSRSKVVFAGVVCALLALNLVVFAAAYPETKAIDSGCCSNRPLARDFSAYYIGAWRLFNDPGKVYTAGYVPDGEYQVLPQPEQYKYMPSFLFLVSPLLSLPYQTALSAFDLFQLLLLPLIALLVYELTKEKGLVAGVLVAAVALLLPSPTAHWSLSAAYYWQWGEGQSKVLDTFLLLLSFVLGKVGRPYLSGIVFGIATYDPRFALISLPLYVMYNRTKLRSALISGIVTFVASNATLLVPGVGSGFLSMLTSSGLDTPWYYYYSLIPILTVASLTLLNFDRIVSAFEAHNTGKGRISAS